MRKTIVYVGTWFAAGAAAVALATAGVSMVGNQVTGRRPAPLSAEDVRDELAADAGTTTTIAAGGTTSTTLGSGTTPTSDDVSIVTTTATRPGTGPTPTTTTTPVAPPETRTYALIGGTATLRFEPTGVKVVVASPNPGYSVETSSTHDNGVRVEFRDDEHASRVDAWWDDGPRDEVREEA